MMTERYPLGPLVALTGWTMTRIREIAPCNGWEYRARQESGVTARTADHLAVTAGLHPYLVWPEMAETAVLALQRQCATEGCPSTFDAWVGTTSGGHNRMHCSDACGSRHRMRVHRARRAA